MTDTPASAENREAKKALATEVLYPREKAKTMAERRAKRPWAREMILMALSAETLDDKGRKTKKLRMIVDRLINMAMAGEQWAIQEVLNRIDGKPQPIGSGDSGSVLPPGGLVNQIQVVFVDANGNISSQRPFSEAAAEKDPVDAV